MSCEKWVDLIPFVACLTLLMWQIACVQVFLWTLFGLQSLNAAGDSSCSRPSSRRRSRCRTRLPQPSGSSFVDAGVLIGCACLHPQSPTTDCHIFPPSVRISPILFPWRVKSVEDPTSSSSNPRAKVRQADVCWFVVSWNPIWN